MTYNFRLCQLKMEAFYINTVVLMILMFVNIIHTQEDMEVEAVEENMISGRDFKVSVKDRICSFPIYFRVSYAVSWGFGYVFL